MRAAVVEFQSRPALHLTGPWSAQDAKNLQEAAGLSDGQGSAFLSDLGAAAALDAEEIWTEFEKPETRQRRLFDIYLGERRYFMMAADYANCIKIYQRLPTFAKPGLDLAQTLSLRLASKDDAEPLIPAYIQVLTGAMNNVESGLKAVTDEKWVTEDVEVAWLRTLLTEAVHAMSVLLQLVDFFGDDFPPSESVQEWFAIMAAYNFFDAVQPVCGMIPYDMRLLTIARSTTVLFLWCCR